MFHLIAGPKVMIGIAVLSLSLIGSCVANPLASSPPLIENTKARNSMEHGIHGRVINLSGDFMPRVGDTETSQNSQTAAAEANVWVFSGKIKAEIPEPKWASVIDVRNHAQLLKVVQTDDNGEFSVDLEPGLYTLFSQSDGALYLNSFDGEGHYAFVEVESDTVSFVELVNSEEAFF